MGKKLQLKNFGVLPVIMMLCISMASWGQTPYSGTYTFTGTSGNVASFAYNGTAITNLTVGSLNKVNVTTSSSGSNSRATNWATGGANGVTPATGAIDLTKYFEFTITAASGYNISNPTITYGVGRSGTGPRLFEWRSSADNYATAMPITTSNSGVTVASNVITTPDDAGTTYTGNVVSLTSTGLTTITFRFYAYGAEASAGTGGLQGALSFGGGLQSNIIPDITTTTVSSITATTATSGGNITADNGSAVTHRGVVWGTAAAPTIALTTKTDDGTGTGTFISNITPLTTNTQYYYRAYATNDIGATNYGTEYSFYTAAITPAAPTLGNPQQTSIDVTVNGNGNAASIPYAIRINGTNYVQADGTVGTSAVWQTAATWGTKTITGLTPGTSYIVDVAAQNTALTSTPYSPSATLSTLSASAPHLTLGAASLAFGNVCTNATTTGSFTFTGENIATPATIDVAALSGYSYSLTSGGPYTGTLSITNFTGAETTVYVLFTPTAVQSYNGSISVAGQGDNATAQFTTPATGAGINTAATVSTVNGATGITQFAATLTGNSVAGCNTVTYAFEYATVSIAPGSGTTVAASTTGATFTVNLSGLLPATTYYYRAKVTDATGTYYGNQYSFVTTSLSAPEATAATDITQTTLTANWTAVSGAAQYLLDVSTNPDFGYYNPSATATDLFISEYAEGSSNNKYIEIYNGTGASVSLTNYRLRLYVNGQTTTTSDIQLSGSLANGATIVYRNGSAAVYTGTSTSNGAINFNGNDAVVLYKISTGAAVDIFGRIGEDPGTAWTADGGYSTLDRTLRRKNTVTGGVTVNPTSGFPTLTTEWDVYEMDNVTNLGTHDFGYVLSYVAGYQALPVSGLSQVVTGLAAYTTYYYRVRANSTTSTSVYSNVISATTKPESVSWIVPNGLTAPEWVPAVTPDSTISTIIAADYNTATNGNFTTNNLTVNTGYSFTINQHGTVTVYGDVVNNAGVNNFTVQDNGALIQRGTATNPATPQVTVVKTANPLYRLDYTLWSAPTTGQTLRQFSMGTSNNRFYEYVSSDAADQGYYPVDPLTTSFDAANRGKGFLIRMPNSIAADATGTTNNGITTPAEYAAGTDDIYFTGEFKGTPNTGTITQTLYSVGSRYTAIGNPYPSPINLAAFYAENSSVIDGASAVYFWRKRNDSGNTTGSYATLTLADFNPNDSGANATDATGGQDNAQYYTGTAQANNWAIAPGQGFLVQTSAAATSGPVVTFTNAMRQAAPTTGGQAFFKSGISAVSRYRMRVTSPNGAASQLSVVYMPQGTLGLDYGYDGKKLGNAGLSIYTLADNTALAIQARPEFEAADVVNAGFKAETAGTYTIALCYTDGIFANGQNIYLKDKAEGIIRNMGEGSYTFTTEAGTFESRFEIIYTTQALDTDTPALDANTVIVYQNSNAININSGSALINSVNVFDIRGRKLYSAEKVNATETAISNLTASQQVLIVEIATDKGTVTKKVIF